MIKLYEWSGIFDSLIKEKRKEELKYLKKNFKIDIMWNFTGELYSQLLQSVAISTYIYMGNHLDLSKAFTILFIIQIFQMCIGWLPTLIPDFILLTVSMNRIQKFLVHEEINPSLMRKNIDKNEAYSVELKNSASFYWG